MTDSQKDSEGTLTLKDKEDKNNNSPEESKDIRKLISVEISELPDNMTVSYLSELLRNETNVIGLRLLPGNKSEVILPSIMEMVQILYQPLYIKGREIKKRPYYNLHFEQKNEVTVFENGILIKIYKGALLPEYFSEYLRINGPQKFDLSRQGIDADFEFIKVTYSEEDDIKMIKKVIGFKGLYINVPHSRIDFSNGFSTEVAHQFHKVYFNLHKKIEKVITDKTQELFDREVSANTDYKPSNFLSTRIKKLARFHKLVQNSENFFSRKTNKSFLKKFSQKNCTAKKPELVRLVDDDEEEKYDRDPYMPGTTIQAMLELNQPDPNKRRGTTTNETTSLNITESDSDELGYDDLDSRDNDDFLFSPENSQDKRGLSDLNEKERLKRNTEIVKERLGGKEVDFNDIPEQEVEQMKEALKKAKKREKQRRANKRKREKEKLEKKKKKNKNKITEKDKPPLLEDKEKDF